MNTKTIMKLWKQRKVRLTGYRIEYGNIILLFATWKEKNV